MRFEEQIMPTSKFWNPFVSNIGAIKFIGKYHSVTLFYYKTSELMLKVLIHLSFLRFETGKVLTVRFMKPGPTQTMKTSQIEN